MAAPESAPRTALVLPVVALTLAAIGLGLTSIRLGAAPFWVDESIAALPARSIHTQGLPLNPFDLDFMPWQLEYGLWDPATPLYRYSLAAFTAVVGFSEWTARLFSVVMGGLAAVALWALARETVGRTTAWVAAALLVTSPTFMVFAREARHFTFLICVSTTTLLLLYVASQRPGSRAAAWWPAGLAATLLTQTLGYAILPIVGLYGLWVGPGRVLDRRHWPSHLGAAVVYGAVMLLFWHTLPFFHPVGCENRTAGCQPDPTYYLGVLNEFLAPMEVRDASRWWTSFSLAQPLALVGLGALVLRGLRDRTARDGAVLLALWLLVPLILLSTREVKFARYLFIWAHPVATLLVARGVVALCGAPGLRRMRDAAAALLVVVLALAPQLQRGSGEDARRLSPRLALPGYVKEALLAAPDDNWEQIRRQVELIEQHAGPDDVVVTSFDDASLGFHSGRFVYGFVNSRRTDEFFMDLYYEARRRGHRILYFDTLPHWNFCLTDDPQPQNVDCARKYRRFHRICNGSLDDPRAPCVRIRIP